MNLLESLPYEEPEEEKIEEVEVIGEEVIEDKLPLQVPTIEKSSTIEISNPEEKKNKLLKKAIQKKKRNIDRKTINLLRNKEISAVIS